MADGYLLLFLISCLLNFDFLCIPFSPAALPSNTFPPVALPFYRHLTLQGGFDFAIKKARKEVVYGSCGHLLQRRKRLFALILCN